MATTNKTNLPAAPGTDLQPIQEIAANIPTLLSTAQEQLVKIQVVVKNLPAIVDESTKNQAFDIRDKIKAAHDTYKDMRMPFTRKLNEYVKQFTTLEAAYMELVTSIESKADKWAAKELEKTNAAKAKAQADLNAKQAAIELDGRIREVLRQKVDTLIDAVRVAAGTIVGRVTKETLDKEAKLLSKIPAWVPATMDPIYYDTPPWVTDKARFKVIADEEKEKNIAYYVESSQQILNDSLAVLPVAVTNKAEADRLQTVAREEDEKKRVLEAEEMKRDVNVEKATAELDTEIPVGPKVKIKAVITIHNNDAWMQMFAFWWKRDPLVKDSDLSKKTLAQIKRFCEEYAFTNGEVIEHESLEYTQSVKAK